MSLLDCIERAATGERMPEHDYDTLCFKEISRAVKEYDLKFPPGEILPTEDSIVDDLWRAAMDVVLTVGGYDIDRERRFRLSEEEIKRGIRAAPSEFTVGTGMDALSVRHRKVGDRSLPAVRAGGVEDSDESLITDIMAELLKIPGLKVAMTYTLRTIEGYDLKGLPYEYMAQQKSVTSVREAARRAGRPGIGIMFNCVSTRAAVQIGCIGPGLLRRNDVLHYNTLPEVFKIGKEMWTLSLASLQHGLHCWATAPAFYGGYAGGWEGATVAKLAGTILMYPVAKVDLLDASPPHFIPNVFYKPPAVYYSVNAIILALGKYVASPYSSASAGMWSLPEDSEGHFYQMAVGILGAVPLGGQLLGNRHHAPRIPMQTTPLDQQFTCDIASSIVEAGLNRQDANELAKRVYNLYTDKMTPDYNAIPTMKGIRDLYDLTKWKPKRELWETYQRAIQKLLDMGVPVPPESITRATAQVNKN